MLLKDRFSKEEAKDVVTSLPLVSPSASVADDLPPLIGTLAVRIVSRFARPRLKLSPTWEEKVRDSTD